MDDTYNVAGTLSDILAKRRLEAQQALIAKLNEEKIRADIAQDQFNGQTSRMNAENQGKYYGKLGENIDFGISKGTTEMTRPGTEINNQDPRLQKFWEDIGMIGSKSTPPTPNVATSTDFQPPAGATPEQIEEFARTLENGQKLQPIPNADGTPPVRENLQTTSGRIFLGSDEQRDKAEARELLQSLMSDPAKIEEMSRTNPTMLGVLFTRAGLASGVPASAIDRTPKTVTPIGPNGQAKPKVDLGVNGSAMELGYPPVGPAPRQPVYIGTEPGTNKPMFQMPNVGPDGKPVITTGNSPIAAKPSAGESRIPVAIRTQLATLRGRATEGGGTPQNPTGTPADKAQYAQAVENFISTAVPPALQAPIRAVLRDQGAYASQPASVIAAHLAQSGAIPAESQIEFEDALNVLRGH